jgi:hypothetical protein
LGDRSWHPDTISHPASPNAQLAQPNIIPSRESDIVGQLDQLDIGKALAHKRGAAILRSILNHDHTQRQRAIAERRQAVAQQAAGIKRNDDDSNRGHSGA